MAGRINELKALIRGAASDIDPRLERGYGYEISDRARASAAASRKRSSAHLLI
jgi:hypothetical protein